MKVTVNKDLCIGCGACADTRSKVFNLDDEGFSNAIVDKVEDQDVLDVEDAIASCPTGAIEKEEE